MINEETQRKLRNMKMEPLVEALQNQQSDLESYAPLDFDSRLTLAIDECYSVKLDDRIRRLTHIAKFRYPDADVHTLIMQGRGFSRKEILGYASCGYIERHKNLIINGFTGAGKTHLACALGKEACRHLYRVKYFRMPELMEQFNYGTEVGRSVASIVKKFSGYDLLIIDEWLLELPTEVEQQYLLEILENRYDAHSTIFCSQYKSSEWYPRLGDGVLADAIMDRIIHNAYHINCGSMNMREYLNSPDAKND